MPKLQARDSGLWWGTLGKLQLMLRKASQVSILLKATENDCSILKALHANGDFTFDQMHHYRMAVTEREVINGCINVENVKDHVIIYTRFLMIRCAFKSKIIFFFRILQNINLQNLKRASAFIDIQDR